MFNDNLTNEVQFTNSYGFVNEKLDIEELKDGDKNDDLQSMKSTDSFRDKIFKNSTTDAISIKPLEV